MERANYSIEVHITKPGLNITEKLSQGLYIRRSVVGQQLLEKSTLFLFAWHLLNRFKTLVEDIIFLLQQVDKNN